MIRYRNNHGRGRREPGSNLRGAPHRFTPDLVGRILSFADALAAASAAEKQSVQLRPVRLPKVKATVTAEADPIVIEPVASAAKPEPVVVPGPTASRFTRVLTSMAEEERASRAAPPAANPRQRLGAPSAAKRAQVAPHPHERAASAIAWLRGNQMSVSVASSTIHGTRWYVSGYPDALDASQVIALAERKGFVQ